MRVLPEFIRRPAERFLGLPYWLRLAIGGLVVFLAGAVLI